MRSTYASLCRLLMLPCFSMPLATGTFATEKTWLKGDFHIHSLHSTDASDAPVKTIIEKAEAQDFDFLVITDHDNHVQGNIQTWSDPDYRSDRLTLLYGAEWTTEGGHANILGTSPYDYPKLWNLRDGDGATSIQAAHDQGLHFSVNHPAAKDGWRLGFNLDFDSMEVWTAVYTLPDSNSKAFGLWDNILMSGRRLAARGGSDSHHQSNFESKLFNIGNPSTWVLAEDRSGEAILKALKAGSVSVSYAPKGELILFEADQGSDGMYETQIGDSLSLPGSQSIPFRVTIVNGKAGKNYEISIIKNGKPWKKLSGKQLAFTFADSSAALERSYYRIEVRGDTPEAPFLSNLAFGRFIGFTNPIYINYL